MHLPAAPEQEIRCAHSAAGRSAHLRLAYDLGKTFLTTQRA